MGRALSYGYSLLELMVALAIIALVLVIAVPASSAAIDRMTFAADAREVTSALRAARTFALDRQTDVVATVSAADRSVLSFSSGQRIALSQGAVVDIVRRGQMARFVIRWNGSTVGALRLRRGARSAEITADPLTGRFTARDLP